MRYYATSEEGDSFARIGMRLAADVETARARLRALDEEAASRPRAVGKWSPKEILGHLVDSAANNHQRFVRAQDGASLRLPGYEQERWVSVQRYRDRPWSELVELWSAYNRHLAHVIAVIPEGRRDTPCHIGDNAPMTLAQVALDYVGHIQHHLRQIFEEPPGGHR
jgi:hypothetical protein